MGAGPPKGNKNALKWTLERSKQVLAEAVEKAGTTKDDKGNYEYDFIGEVARDMGYYKSLFMEIRDKYPRQLNPIYRKLIDTLEANCFRNSKKGAIREATAIVNLKSNHKWTDRQDLTSKGQKIEQNIIVPDNETAEELKKLKD
jgi:hypothetical protein